MPMSIQPTPALLVGLGARVFLDFLHRTEEASVKDHILLGVWQGVALHYAFKSSNLGLLVAVAITGKLFIEFNTYPDLNKCATTVIGVVLGFLGTDLITQFVDSAFSHPTPSSPERRRRKISHSAPHPLNGIRERRKRQRLVQFRASVQGGSIESEHYPKYHPVSDITSVDSNSDLIRIKENMTPLEREIAALRARASLADSERRRYREERKWAISEGNMERAAQLKQQVKRYTVLMQSFHREADIKMLSGVQNPTPQANGATVDGQRSSTSPIQERQPRIRRSSLSNGQPSSTTWEPKPGPSRRSGAALLAPTHIRRDSTR